MILLDLFSGIGGFHLGLERAGFEFDEVYFSEIDAHAIANYKNNFKQSKYVGDVKSISTSGIRRPNIITFGSPCFIKGTKVLTIDGFKDISDIVINNMVLTHTGRWCRVSQTNVKEHIGNIHTIKLGKDTEPITCTPEHPFYVVKKTVLYNSKTRKYDISWSNPYWEEAKNLNESHYVVVANQAEDVDVDITESEAYLFGYYLAEGWLDKVVRKRDGKNMFRIYFGMHEDEKQHFESIIEKIKYRGRFKNKNHISVSFSTKYEGKAIKATISNERLYNLFKMAGDNSLSKIIPGVILSASKNIQKHFLDGYMYGDGSFNKNDNTYTALSKNIEMAYGLRHLIVRVHKELANIFYTKVKPTTIINGRVVNQSPYYSIRWKPNKAKEVFSYKVNNKIVIKVVKNETRKTIEPVYNFTVEGDNTYTVGNYVVHNCQDFSLAGKRRGLDGERSSLIDYALRAISEFRPDVFVWENVKGAFSSNNSEDFWAIIQAFANLGGYRLEWQLLNTAWVLPQNRERIYLVGHLTESFRNWRPIFPIGENDFTFRKEAKSNRNGLKTKHCSTLGTGYGNRQTDTYLKIHSRGRGFCKDSVNEVCPTIRGSSFENNTSVIQVPSATKKGYEIAKSGDSINLQFLDSKTRRGRVGNGVAQTLDCNCEQGVFLSGTRHKHGEDGTYADIAPTIQSRYGTGGNNMPYINNIRRLTEIECERLQGFPDDWTKYGDYGEVKEIAKTNRYKLIGNAVTVNIVELVAKRIKINYDNNTNKNNNPK